MQETKRATIYFDPAIHHALRIKAADLHCSISEIVNAACARRCAKTPMTWQRRGPRRRARDLLRGAAQRPEKHGKL